MDNPFLTWYFWLLVVSVIFLVLFLIFYEKYGITRTGKPTPQWVWWLGWIALGIFIVSVVMYILTLAKKKGAGEEKNRIEKALEGYYGNDADIFTGNTRKAPDSVIDTPSMRKVLTPI